MTATPAISRRALARAAIASTLLLAATAGGIWAARRLAGWLHARPEYALNFDEIALDPPPPAWLKGGAKGLLDEVRRKAALPERISAVGVDLDALTVAFKLGSPWVERVERVWRPGGNRLSARLVYREPVALVPFRSGPILLTSKAIVVPIEDVDLAALPAPPIPIWTLGPEVEARNGLTLKVAAVVEGPYSDEVPAAAAALAGFVGARRSGPGSLPVAKILTDGTRLGLVLEGKTRVVWRKPDDPDPGDDRRWQHLLKWVETNGSTRLAVPGTYLDVGPSGVRVKQAAP